MGFTDKTPEYQACVKFSEAISPINKNKNTAVVELTSPTESANDNTEILFVKKKKETGKITKEKKDEQTHVNEEHEKNTEDDNNNEEDTKTRTEN